MKKEIFSILSKYFCNGYRLGSPIELSRFRSRFKEDFGKELLLSDYELNHYIIGSGITYDNKVYIISGETKDKIKNLVSDYFDTGARVIFFSEFFSKNENWLIKSSVVSEDLLSAICRILFFKCSFTKRYFGYLNDPILNIVADEILRVWGSDILLNYDQLSERLLYIPLEDIKYVLGQNGDFIRNSKETFSHISKIYITDEEKEAICSVASRECEVSGYVSVTKLPSAEISANNNQLSAAAVYNAVYRICLSDKFNMKGRIITRKGHAVSAQTIIEEYCRERDRCTLKELLDYEKDLTGEIHRFISMGAGNNILVRIDKNNYVADKFVRFDSELIDNAIEMVFKGEYMPLKCFTAFGMFPDCGYAWNLFLLESYCRRFSKRFRFDVPAVNSHNAGAVIRRSCKMNYTQIMADAAVNAAIPLNEVKVNDFLYENGYIGKRTTSKISEIIEEARRLREGRI